MFVPKEQTAGDTIRAEDFNQHSAGLRALMNARGTRGLDIDVIGGGLEVRNRDHVFQYPAQGTTIPAVNTGVPVNQFEPVQIEGIGPADATAFAGDPMIEVTLADGTAGKSLAIIASSEIGTNDIGVVYRDGIVPCPVVRAAGVTGDRAALTSGAQYLTAGADGQARILWEESVVDPTVAHWAVIQFDANAPQADRGQWYFFTGCLWVRIGSGWPATNHWFWMSPRGSTLNMPDPLAAHGDGFLAEEAAGFITDIRASIHSGTPAGGTITGGTMDVIPCTCPQVDTRNGGQNTWTAGGFSTQLSAATHTNKASGEVVVAAGSGVGCYAHITNFSYSIDYPICIEGWIRIVPDD
jgi:hypothetical protein